jgi:Resolvase, N terminal domain
VILKIRGSETMGQFSFFDADKRLAVILAKGDPLEMIDRVVPLESFRAEFEAAFDALCKDAARRQFDMVMAWSVDRLGPSLKDLIDFLSELQAPGIDLMLHQQGLDTTTLPAAMDRCFHLIRV